MTCLVPLFFSKTRQSDHFWYFWTQDENVARYARNDVKGDFFCNFRTPCYRESWHDQHDLWMLLLHCWTI